MSRILYQGLIAALVVAAVAGAFLGAAEPRQSATTPSGAYLMVTFLVFCGLLAWGCTIPHLPPYDQTLAE